MPWVSLFTGFCLKAKTGPPECHACLLLSLQVFTRECMSHYLRAFNFLWRAKRMEYILTDIRKGHMCNARLLRSMPGKSRRKRPGGLATG